MRCKISVLALALSIFAAATPAQDDREPVTWCGYLVDARYVADLESWESLSQKAKKYPRERGLRKKLLSVDSGWSEAASSTCST